jgi:stage V sporulation protein R
MQLIDQHSKQIMEGCKERAREAGLRFDAETLEYIVTNRDLLELSSKSMIPNLYDYWVHDVEVLREKGRYDLYPSNPYETVINTRPVISFYNDNNPDWLNVMIFYHVLAHIDFFQNNLFFQHTWDYDFNGEALADKRFIARLRSTKGRWVDYLIEFSRSIDNLVGYFDELYRLDQPSKSQEELQLDYYFDHFLQSERRVKQTEYLKELELFNAMVRENQEAGQRMFFSRVSKAWPEFDEKLKSWLDTRQSNRKLDLMQFIMEHSEYLNKYENKWMKSVMAVVRKTSLFFQPQIRTKIMNEGWATYWHERLFLDDERIRGQEVNFSKTHSGVASLSRLGLNPYALGLRLFQEIEASADTGRYSFEFERILDQARRKAFDGGDGSGRELVFAVRRHFCDSQLIRSFVTQDFVDRYKLFVAGKRLNRPKRSWEYYVKSRRAEDYRAMLLGQLYHPPKVDFRLADDGSLSLVHRFEGKPLVKDFIGNTMLGIEYLWGRPVSLVTHQVKQVKKQSSEDEEPEITWERVKYTMSSRKLSKQRL